MFTSVSKQVLGDSYKCVMDAQSSNKKANHSKIVDKEIRLINQSEDTRVPKSFNKHHSNVSAIKTRIKEVNLVMQTNKNNISKKKLLEKDSSIDDIE